VSVTLAPARSGDWLAEPGFGVYVHIPFCLHRCHYCDFNTYEGLDALHSPYVDALVAEIERWNGATTPATSVFFGGGTPTLLPAADLVRVLDVVRASFGLAADAEVTTEANPDSVTADSLARLRDGGFTRISYGMQSAVPHVLATLDRTHNPERVPLAVEWARAAGFQQVSIDLIHGTPGESLADWRQSVQSALAMRPDHVSAYALVVEPGTALARRVARGEVTAPDDDQAADAYELAERLLSAAGLRWYELSSWAARADARSRHNLGYWRGADWWGVGPGAHSHVGGVRWWNVKHPTAYGNRIGAGLSPAQARETLDQETRRVERVLLETRLAEGLQHDVLDDAGRAAVPGLVADGSVDVQGDRLVLTPRGRLLADAVVRRLLP